MAARRFRVNGPNLVSEIIDGEAVIVNLEKGSYYSLAREGADIWSALKDGASEREIVESLLERYNSERTNIESALADLVGQLEKEGVIVEETGESENGHAIGAGSPSAERPVFERPVLHKYTDMEAILMLDPIHEVDETGWPSAKRPG